MPPRNRKPADTTVDTPEFTGVDVDTAETLETPETPEKTRKTRVTAKDAVILSAITVATEAPPIMRKSTKDNPFTEHVAKSYQQDLEANDDWLQFNTNEDDAENQCRLIRAAGSTLNVGTAIRVSESNHLGQVTVFFRGQERKARKAKVSE